MIPLTSKVQLNTMKLPSNEARTGLDWNALKSPRSPGGLAPTIASSLVTPPKPQRLVSGVDNHSAVFWWEDQDLCPPLRRATPYHPDLVFVPKKHRLRSLGYGPQRRLHVRIGRPPLHRRRSTTVDQRLRPLRSA